MVRARAGGRSFPSTRGSSVVGLCLLCATWSFSADINVSGTTDEDTANGYCSFREAIKAATTNTPYGGCVSGAGAATIRLPRGRYRLTLGELVVTGNNEGLYILGGTWSPVDTIIDAEYNHRVMRVADNTGGPILMNLTLTGGMGSLNEGGGAIFIENSPATLDDCVVKSNQADGGGAIRVENGTLRTYKTTIWNNYSDTVENVLNHGGAISAQSSSTVDLQNTTVSYNVATSDGGAIYASGPGTTVKLRNVTISDNYCGTSGTNGDGGGVILILGATLELSHTIIAGNTDLAGDSYPDCYAYLGPTLTSFDHNIVGDATGCSIVAGPSDHFGSSAVPVDPKLGPLTTYHGGAMGHMPAADSPAFEGGSSSAGLDFAQCRNNDQRGQGRPADSDLDGTALCEIGALEQNLLLFRDGFESGDTGAW